MAAPTIPSIYGSFPTNVSALPTLVPIAPVAPNFAFCHPAYGTGLASADGIMAGSALHTGSLPVVYDVLPENPGNPSESGLQVALQYSIPTLVIFGKVALTVEVAGPVDITNIRLVPDNIRGMAGYLANTCLAARGTGGFVTRGLQDLVEYITNPRKDVHVGIFPPPTAFVTVTMSTVQHQHAFAGDCDPFMGQFLEQCEIGALSAAVLPGYKIEISERIEWLRNQTERMHRLGTVAWWDDPEEHSTVEDSLETQISNATDQVVTISRRKRRIRIF